MSIPTCSCDRHCLFLAFKPLVSRPTCQHSSLRFTNSTYKWRARVAAAAVEAETQALSQSAIRRIAEKLHSLGFVEESSHGTPNDTLIEEANSPGKIFVPLPSHLPKHRVGHTLDQSWSTPENPVPEPGSGSAIQRFHELRRGFMEEEERFRQENRGKKEKTPSMAELTLPDEELRRLRSVGIQLRKKLKVGKAGITEGIVNGIHERWRRSELVKITCEDICRLNMKRTHELLERKTGGLVIWRSGSNIILYRGPNYKYPYFIADTMVKDSSSDESSDMEKDPEVTVETASSSSLKNAQESSDLNYSVAHPPLVHGVGLANRVRFQLPGEAELAEEANTLLEGLGPRFNDWWGYDPLPVDADLLPAIVPGFKRPFRLLPYGVQPKLTNDELNILRRLARPLPCHFALGRNKKLQGLAASIVKLWEKCEISKIAIKRGVQNTNSELMADELKLLTGGTLLSRDREFIVFYRGKDFLPAAVSSAIDERRKHGINVLKNRPLLNGEEDTDESKESASGDEPHEESSLGDGGTEKQAGKVPPAAIKRTNTKLSEALEKKAKAEKLLEELEKKENPQVPETDREGITEEERYMLRRVGLKMKPFLLMGRRGIFGGTIENMHLHWKYRELVKVCIGKRSMEEIHRVARTLEAESGGILVAVEPSHKGYYIIVYRGKNYKRPASLRPQTLLSKREALKLSIEAQRHQSLKLHVLKLNKTIDELQRTSIESKNNEGDDGESETSSSETSNDYEKSSFDESANELEAKESHESDATFRRDVENFIQGEPPGIPTKEMTRKLEPSHTTRKSLNHGSLPAASSIAEHEPKPSTQNNTNDTPLSRASTSSGLSNRERLLLRKQALSMKKPPVLAVGKSNGITGVSKAIKEHFRKHPLAIVNIKGRAKGTSIQEVIYNLEQSTGAVFVSQEPSKVILYRGWGAAADKERKINSVGQAVKQPPAISPELVSAIRLECGLECDDGESPVA